MLIAYSCLGGILSGSSVHGGSITDPEIVDAWKHLASFPQGSHLLADKGWVDYTNALLKYGIVVITPDKKRTGATEFTADDSLWNQEVAALRIHVERAIKRIREFKIINTRCPICRKDMMTSIMNVCSLLVNFKGPTGGRDMDLHTLDAANNPLRVSAYTLMWAPSILGWNVPTPATAPKPRADARR